MSDQCQFQCESSETIEIVQLASTNLSRKIPIRTKKRKTQLDIAFKYQTSKKLSKVDDYKLKPAKTFNISFKDQEDISDGTNDEEQYNENYRIQSSFMDYYKKYEIIYNRNCKIGTNWIGNRQYFASIFLNTKKIINNQNNNILWNYQLMKQSKNHDKNKIYFNSQFQSGNLFIVYQIKKYIYDLILQNDINTKGNTQWFYFLMKNVPANTEIEINIVNFRKPDSLFNYGMLPCIYSLLNEKKNGITWYREAKNVKYFKNQHQIENSRKYYYTLSFIIYTPHHQDILKVAHCYPYTVTDWNLYIENLLKIKFRQQWIHRQNILQTIGKNNIQVLSIKQNNSFKKNNNPLIVVIARQHPGETPSSFICQGLIDFFTSKQKQGQYLRNNYEIKIIPIVNPDGVTAGNYRTNLQGFDLNRKWDCSSKSTSANEVKAIKKYLNECSRNRQIVLILDLHGHSRKLFSFFYGNPMPTNPKQVRIFPYICSKLSMSCIRFEDSTFTLEESKRQTARIQLGMNSKINQIYTFQTSFYGYITKDKEKKHFTIDGYKQLGMILGKAIFINQRRKLNPLDKQIFLYQKCMRQLQSDKNLISIGQKVNSGSDSNPEECSLRIKQENILQKNQDYTINIKNVCNPHLKIIRKKIKRQSPINRRDTVKSSRNMKVMQLNKVNSIYPHDVLALMPNSIYYQSQKNQLNQSIKYQHVEVQTDYAPLVKLCQACKLHEIQQMSALVDYNRYPSKTHEINRKEYKASSNIIKLGLRPSTSNFSTHSNFNIYNGKKQQKQIMQSKKYYQDKPKKTVQVKNNQIKTTSKAIQTIISFSNQSYLMKTLKKNDHKYDNKLFSTIHETNNSNDIKPLESKQTIRFKKKSII